MVLISIRLLPERIFYEKYSALIDYFVCKRRFTSIIKKGVYTAEKSALLGGPVVIRKNLRLITNVTIKKAQQNLMLILYSKIINYINSWWHGIVTQEPLLSFIT